MTTIHDTQPIPRVAFGEPAQRFYPHDFVTDTFQVGGVMRRFVGSVIDSDKYVFRCRWVGGHGVATYAHSHEPDTLRVATPADEREALADNERLSTADELLRLARKYTVWPAEVRHVLQRRATELAGGA